MSAGCPRSPLGVAMLRPLAQPALVQNGLQPVWQLSRALLSRSPRAAVVLAAASSSNGGGVAPYKKEHLVWEDGFGTRFAGSLLVCCAVAVGASLSPGAWLPAAHGAQAALRRQLLRLCHRLEWWSALGLLSSSCCALQLLLNSLSFGCAGFNTVLGPLRPQLLALTTTLQLGMWRSLLSGGAAGAHHPSLTPPLTLTLILPLTLPLSLAPAVAVALRRRPLL